MCSSHLYSQATQVRHASFSSFVLSVKGIMAHKAHFVVQQWPIWIIGSRDTAGGQGLWNCRRKKWVSADCVAQS